MENNKFQWGRIDEILMFAIALVFVGYLAYLDKIPVAAITSMGGSLMMVVPIYIKAALERRNGYENDTASELKTPPKNRSSSPPSANSSVPENPIHFLREDS
jgi:hypothetical protein